MNITAVNWQDDEHRVLFVEHDGKKTHIPWPCATWHREHIEAWLNNGNEIGPSLDLLNSKDISNG